VHHQRGAAVGELAQERERLRILVDRAPRFVERNDEAGEIAARQSASVSGDTSCSEISAEGRSDVGVGIRRSA
jgi:hypothetical protein